MAIESSGKLLVRVPGQHVAALSAANLRAEQLHPILGAGAVEPLFHHSVARNRMLNLAPPEQDWLLHTPGTRASVHPWDQAHALAREVISGAHGQAEPDVYVEPDLRHERTGFASVPPQLRAAPIANAVVAPPYLPNAGLNAHYPPDSKTVFSPAWNLYRHGFDKAWATSTGAGVRIAHLDVGYWPQQYSTPRNMRRDLGRNCVAGEDPNNTTDPGTGLNPGHGTATLALVAGNKVDLMQPASFASPQRYTGYIGGAYDAEVIPVRVAGVDGSVVHLYSANLARGMDYAASPSDGVPCDVVTLSHGGLPAQSWADAVNRLYEKGIVMVAAAGDSFHVAGVDLATHYTVYPSAFYRVVTATGVTYDNKPYINNQLGSMQGCWGPDKVMKKALAAATPNVPWMAFKTQYGWDMDGAGTSASTPQIAAACALWLARYGKEVGLTGWQRVAACRHALFESVGNRQQNLAQIGVGTLDANAMLSEQTLQAVKNAIAQGKLPYIEPDKVSAPFWRLLFGIAPPGSGVDEMYETEAAQLLHTTTNPALLDAFHADAEGGTLSALSTASRNALREAFLRHPDISETLKHFLQALPAAS